MTDLQLLAHLLDLAGHDVTSARELAHALLDGSKDLQTVLAMSGPELERFPGLSEDAAVFLRLVACALYYYVAVGHVPEFPVRKMNGDDLIRFLTPSYQPEGTERACIFCLGDDLELLTAAMVAQGGPTAVSCSVPRMLELALVHRSKSVLLAHNHPNGAREFSKSDLLATSVVTRAMTAAGISLADHLLMSGGAVLSLRDQFYQGKIKTLPFQPPKAWAEQPSLFCRVVLHA